MWTRINKLPFTLLLLFLFASCDKEDNMGDTGGGSEEIRFEIAVGTATATPSGLETRVATSPTYECTFENGDEIGVFIVKGSGGLQPSGNWVDNMKMTYNSGTWTPTFPSGKDYYPTDGDLLHFYAYYPYNAAVSDALNMNIPGLADQSSAANLSKSDLLTATTPNIAKSPNPIQLSFTHVLAMVELKVTNGGIRAQMSDRVVTTLQSCKNSVTVNLSTKAATTTGSAAAVTMGRVEQSTDLNYLTSYTYRAFVPAQTVEANKELFRFSQTEGSTTRTLSHKPSSQVALVQSIVKPYRITLQGELSGPVYSVGDYYPDPDVNLSDPIEKAKIVGVVFRAKTGAKPGLVVSIDETTKAWSPYGVYTGATDIDNGALNMAKIKGLANWETDYPAFKWCDAKGAGWYLPAWKELVALYNAYNADRSAFNSKLTSVTGGTALVVNKWYWSSWEDYDANHAGIVTLDDGYTLNSYKTDYNRVRAVLAF